ncbi:hypothetical protein NCWK1_0748 [Nostoc cycadae WK-1]|uniref:Uncharacterized protein n=1 Tax=Nostoc cycadae WK-1 TaxID=1861711 RepID=A0A2H6LD01_9NOSO|nr:hypothetical protein NCWK1_0748 [Nostoc cycadae WK-1]
MIGTNVFLNSLPVKHSTIQNPKWYEITPWLMKPGVVNAIKYTFTIAGVNLNHEYQYHRY